MEQPTLKSPVDDVLHLIADAITSWKAQNSPEELKRIIHKQLDAQANQVMLKMLGFNTNYRGQWQIDHCNGRSGNSPMGDYLKEAQDVVIKEWLSKAAMPKLTEAMEKPIQKSMSDEYARTLLEKAKQQARHQATNDLNTLVEKLTATNGLEAFMKVQDILNG